MATPDWRRLRTTFDEVPELYERVRPTYPPKLFDDLAELAGLGPGARVLEIGCGTGQATLPLAERGFAVVCVELGERLAAIARTKLERFPAVEVVTGSFEETRLPVASFDAVVAFTSFHWVDPELRYGKTARVLRARGALGLVGTQHVLPPDGDAFFRDVQADYAAIGEEDTPPPAPEEVVDHWRSEIVAGGFPDVEVRRYVWDVPYSADEYVAVLETYSGHRALAVERRERLYELIRARIAGRPGGQVTKTYAAILHVAKRA